MALYSVSSNRYTKQDSSSLVAGTTAQNFNQATANQRVAQYFAAGTSNKLLWAYIWFSTRVLTPTGNLYVELWSDNAAPEGGTLLATSDVIPAADIVVGNYVGFKFSGAQIYTLTATTNYYLVLKSDTALSATNYFTLYRNTAGSNFWLYATGGVYVQQTNMALRFVISTNADGGAFDMEAAAFNVADLTAAKGDVASATTDYIYVMGGITFTRDAALSLMRLNVGEMSTALTGAPQTAQAYTTVAGKYAIINDTSTAAWTFGGGAANTLSGLVSNPATPSATYSILSQYNCHVASVMQNPTAVAETSTRWTIQWSYGRLNISNPGGTALTTHGTWGSPFNSIAMDSTKTSAAPIINNCVHDGFTNATFYPYPTSLLIDMTIDFRYNSWDASNVTTNLLMFYVCKCLSGGSIDLTGSKFICGCIAATTFSPFLMSAGTWYYSAKIAFADIRNIFTQPQIGSPMIQGALV